MAAVNSGHYGGGGGNASTPGSTAGNTINTTTTTATNNNTSTAASDLLTLYGSPGTRYVNETALQLLVWEMVAIMTRTMADAQDKEAVFFKLEMLGYTVGQRLVEKFTKDLPRFNDNLEVVKFICKDFWNLVFRKQIDNLKTNHRGVYVLQDSNFRWFARMSSEQGTAESAREVAAYVWFPCGLIRGALANLGVVSVVMAESTTLPQCTFQIKIAGKA
ncbi:hypothetical protein RI367_006982 [Sorochytrium milnesiophthora]